MPHQFSGKVAVVTGAGAGIGRATAIGFAGAGAAVVVADVRVNPGADTVRIIEAQGGRAAFVEIDVTRAADVRRMVAHALDTFGRLDFAVNNAGTMHPIRPLAEQAEEDF